MTAINSALKTALTGKDNESFDFSRILVMLSVLVALVLQCYHTLTTGEFDLMQYGTGIGALLIATGITIKAKEGSEP